MSNTMNRHQELRVLLERLKLAGMAASFTDLALKAAKESLSHEAYLHELAKREEALRQERRTERLLRQSGLPVEKTFRTFDLKRLSPALQLQIERLKQGAFLERLSDQARFFLEPGEGHAGAGELHLRRADEFLELRLVPGDVGVLHHVGIVEALEAAGFAAVEPVERRTKLDAGARACIVARRAEPLKHTHALIGALRPGGQDQPRRHGPLRGRHCGDGLRRRGPARAAGRLISWAAWE